MPVTVKPMVPIQVLMLVVFDAFLGAAGTVQVQFWVFSPLGVLAT